ncbi:hypothetical protein CUMW_229450 [Citrus unshiu]|uniref:Uncharacterized protein n=1 Tax=Citrus unshiu TaxID=55188 RepID=A0A2H5QH10_CITUN|nr:hypothetical protein CUMW_229450 [Citrus unshiu]
MTDPAAPPWLHLISAFLAMEPSDSLVSLARVCGDGSVTERVQRFIWNYCISRAVGKAYAPYLRNFVKKLIVEVESIHGEVLDEIYELYADIITSLKDDQFVEKSMRVRKTITFLFPDGNNYYLYDVGNSISDQPISLVDDLVGSGVGLVGICLAHVKASKVTLTDGDHLTLANMRSNLELNQLSTNTSLLESYEDPNVVQCVHLPWESASESGLSAFVLEIILGADILYDRSCFPDLVRILAILLNRRKSVSSSRKESSKGFTLDTKCNTNDLNDLTAVTSKGPVAYIATVIRNIDTFNYFLSLVEQANLSITDLTEAKMPFNLFPYMQSYDRSNMRLFTVSSKA